MVNKIFKQRMEDPEPLEIGGPRRPRGVRRDRPQAHGQEARRPLPELRRAARRPRPLDRPRRVRAILGAEADAARSFRPPPPELDEDDLRLLDGDDPSIRDAFSLRDLGDAEPSDGPPAPAPPAPVSAVVRPSPSREARSAPTQRRGDDSAWLFQFAMVAIAVGLVAVILIAIFFRS